MRDRTPFYFALTFTKNWMLQPRQVTLYNGCGNCWLGGDKWDFNKQAASWDQHPGRLKPAKDIADAISDEQILAPDMDILE